MVRERRRPDGDTGSPPRRASAVLAAVDDLDEHGAVVADATTTDPAEARAETATIAAAASAAVDEGRAGPDALALLHEARHLPLTLFRRNVPADVSWAHTARTHLPTVNERGLTGSRVEGRSVPADADVFVAYDNTRWYARRSGRVRPRLAVAVVDNVTTLHLTTLRLYEDRPAVAVVAAADCAITALELFIFLLL
jgi:hypothetical protein